MNNPLLQKFGTPHEATPFQDIKIEHYRPAFIQAIADAKKEIDAIANATEPATFANTIEALECAGELLDKVAGIFFNLNHADTNEKMQELAREISPMLSEFANDIVMNEALFERVKLVYQQNLSLTNEQQMLLNNRYKSFVRSGANLDKANKERMREISKQLSQLTLQFGENVLAATNNYQLHITNKEDLSGIPEGILEAAKATAEAQKKEGWIFNLQFPSYVPFMQYADNRCLREQMFRAYSSRCFNDNYDNQEIINQIVALRLEKANLLGYKTYADYVLEERMAESSDNVMQFLDELLADAMVKAVLEFNELQQFAKDLGADFELQRWDWAYYAEKLKTQKFDINDEITRPYFELERVRKGIFDLATQLYGITFKANTNLPKYHEEVDVYEVFDAEGKFLALFYTDFYPRSSKQGGAWMTGFTEQYIHQQKDYRPHVSIVCNFTRPTATKPSLLTFNEVTTFLHEFGHALHGMLTRCNYASLSGTNVYRDFVELPSQFMENFATQKEWLNQVAKHYKTGEIIPADLVQKLIDSENFLSGYSFVRQISFGLNDMAWHTISEKQDIAVADFETKAMASTELFQPIAESCMSTAFSHIFAGGYAAGYYGYKWAEVLDADAFEAFKENGIFDKATADAFRENILEKGGTEHPMDLYLKFRNKKPSVDALLKRSGLK